MNRNVLLILVVFVVLFSSCSEHSSRSHSLFRSSPGAEGVSAGNVLDFINAVEKSKHELHSLMILRHGKVVAEGWWNPYQPELKHSLYSASKSFTSTAIGFAVTEKRLSLSDKVVSFFPNDVPDTVSSYLASLTVKDLLTMSAGQEPDPTFKVVTRDTNWVRSFLSTPIKNKPGTKFLYNTLATYMLSAIVQKVTGEKVVDYLKPRLFEPLAIEGMDWEVDPQGRNTGGWGLRLKTEDLAKFGQLLLQKGKWNDIQILPPDWVEEATSFKIDQEPDAPQAKKDTSDWLQGYCYQFWRCRNNAFRADGAYGQYVIVLPEKDAVIVMTGESPNMQQELNLVWQYLLPAFKTEKLSENKSDEAELNDKLASLTLPIFTKTANSNIVKKVNGMTFVLVPNELALDSLSLSFNENRCNVSEFFGKDAYEFGFGSGNWKIGETPKPGPMLLTMIKAHDKRFTPLKVAGNYQWKDSLTLTTKLRYIESPHSQASIFRFANDSIYAEVQNSQDFGSRKITIKGVMRK